MGIRCLMTVDSFVGIAALRMYFRTMLEAREAAERAGVWISPGEAAARNIRMPDWLADCAWERIVEADRQARSRTLGQLRCQYAPELQAMIDECAALGDFGSQAERAARLAGTSHTHMHRDARRAPQRRWSDIDSELFAAFFAALPAGNPVEAINSVVSRKPAMNAVPRLLVRSAWLTGMRSIEMFRCSLVQPVSDDAGASAVSDPMRSFRDGLLVPVGQPHTDGPVIEPRILLIRTAKTRNASPNLKEPMRALILGGIPPEEFEWLAAAARLEQLNLSRFEIRRILDRCRSVVRTTSLLVCPDRADPITLHTFRHAFVSEARRVLSAAETAALTGHTALRTLNGYGRRGAAGRRSTRWLPEPDPARAAGIHLEWRSEPGVAPEPVSEPPRPRLEGDMI